MIPDPRSGELTITHRQEGDTVVYTATQTFTRELLLAMVNGKPAIVSLPRNKALEKGR